MNTSAAWVAVDESGNPLPSPCLHVTGLPAFESQPPPQCVDCIREGSRWVHLRQCLVCGEVRCCDNSPRRHATAHWHASAHAVIRSYEPGETWGWCYAEDLSLTPAEAG